MKETKAALIVSVIHTLCKHPIIIYVVAGSSIPDPMTGFSNLLFLLLSPLVSPRSVAAVSGIKVSDTLQVIMSQYKLGILVITEV